MLGNDAVKSHITWHESEILDHFELVVNTASMEDAVQQQRKQTKSMKTPDCDAAPNAENGNPDSESDNEMRKPGDNIVAE